MQPIYRYTVTVLVIISLALIAMPPPGFSEMYTWTDADGVRHYSNYPPPSDVSSVSSQKEIVSPGSTTPKQQVERSDQHQARVDHEQETRVIVLGNAVIVPVTFGYQGRQIKAKLLLDTGAAHTVYFETAASRQNVVEFSPIKGRVAGGGEIKGQGVVAEYLQVGSKIQPNVKVFIIKQVGSTSGADGLLGMSFLKHHKHYVDMERKVIVWLDE